MLKLSSHAPPTPPDKGYETQRPSERSGERGSHSGCRWCVFPRNLLRPMFEKPKMHLNAISQDMTPGRHPARLTVVLKRLCAGGAGPGRGRPGGRASRENGVGPGHALITPSPAHWEDRRPGPWKPHGKWGDCLSRPRARLPSPRMQPRLKLKFTLINLNFKLKNIHRLQVLGAF